MPGGAPTVVARSSDPEAEERVVDLAPTGRRWTALIAVAIAALTLVVHNASPNVTSSDSVRFVPAAESLVARGSLDVSWSRTLPNGGVANTAMYQEPGDLTAPIYPYYPLGPVLVAVPVVAAGRVTDAVGLTGSVEAELRRKGTWRLERLTASLVIAATTAILYLVAYLWFAGSPRRRRSLAAAVALAFAFATPAWTTGSRGLWQHGPSMLMLSLALLIAVRARTDDRPVALLGVVLGAAYLMRPTNSVAILAFSAWVAVCHRRRLLAHLAGLGAVLAGLAMVNLKLYGGLLAPYYRPGRQGHNPDLLEALAGNLVSPARGIFAFSPILLLALVGVAVRLRRREVQAIDLTVWAVVVGHWLVISVSAPQWWGGYAIGPRLFSDMVPLLVFAALPALDRLPSGRPAVVRLATVALVAGLLVSVAVQAQGAMMRSMWCWNALPRNIDQYPERVWTVRHGQLVAGVNALRDGRSWASETVPGGATTTDCAA